MTFSMCHIVSVNFVIVFSADPALQGTSLSGKLNASAFRYIMCLTRCFFRLDVLP